LSTNQTAANTSDIRLGNNRLDVLATIGAAKGGTKDVEKNVKFTKERFDPKNVCVDLQQAMRHFSIRPNAQLKRVRFWEESYLQR